MKHCYSGEFDIKVISALFRIVEQRPHHPFPHSMTCWRLYWNPDGGERVVAGVRSFQTPADTLTLIAPYTPISLHMSKAFRHFYVHFSLNRRFNMIRNHIFQCKIDGLFMRGNRCFLEDFDIVNEDNALHISSMICYCLSRLPRDVWDSAETDARILDTLDFMDNNLRKNLDNQQLAKRVFLSCNAFIRLFKQHVTLAPREYLIKRRLEHAARLLAETNLSLEKIAEQCGFCNRNYLTKVFTAEYKVGPAFFRKNL